MGARYRTHVKYTLPGGSYTPLNPPGPTVVIPSIGVTESCNDFVGDPHGVHNLDLVYNDACPGWVSGSDSWYSRASMRCQSVDMSGLPYPSGIPSVDSLYTTAMAVTNPNRPVTEIWMAIQDLVDIPHLIRDIGDFALGLISSPTPRMVAKGYLTKEFGIDPSIQDLIGVSRFISAVEKRKKELRALRDHGLRRVYTHGGKGHSSTVVSSPRTAYASSLYQEKAKFQYTCSVSVRTWATVRWQTDSSVNALVVARPGSTLEAALSAYGVLDGVSVWELIPWTWLFNWFSNIGDYLSAHRNTIPVHASNGCIMTHTVTRIRSITPDPSCPPGISFSINANGGGESKIRRVNASPSPNFKAFLPFLDGSQLSILAALAVSRGPR